MLLANEETIAIVQAKREPDSVRVNFFEKFLRRKIYRI